MSTLTQDRIDKLCDEREQLTKQFYNTYLGAWDYLRKTALGGEAWKLFVKEKAPELANIPKPVHHIHVPISRFLQYMVFLHAIVAEMYDADVATFDYDIELALEDFIHSNHGDTVNG